MKRTKIFKVIICLSIFSILVSSTFLVSAATVNSSQKIFKTISGKVVNAYMGAKKREIKTITSSSQAIMHTHEVIVDTMYLNGTKSIKKRAKFTGPTTSSVKNYSITVVPTLFKSGKYLGFVFYGTATCTYEAGCAPEATTTKTKLKVKIPVETC